MENASNTQEIGALPPLWQGWRAFAIAAGLWGVFGAVATSQLDGALAATRLRLVVFGAYWGLSLLNLFLLAKTLENLFAWMHPSTKDPLEKTRRLFGTALSAALKFATLGVIIWGLVQYPYSFKWALMLGLGTLIIVPLVGGWIWFRKAIPNGSPRV